MRLPRVQFTLRQMMASVIVVELCTYGVTLKRRADWIRQQRKYHTREFMKTLILGHGSYEQEKLKRLNGNYHLKLSLKYERAAERPWLLIPEDSPAPRLSGVTSRK